MGTHEQNKAHAQAINVMTAVEREHASAHYLERALGGLYAPVRRAALQRIVRATLDAGGLVAVEAFVAACREEARRDAHGRLPGEILSRAHAGDARAREGAPVPESEDRP